MLEPVTCAQFEEILSNCHGLEYLSIIDTPNLNNDVVTHIITNCPNIIRLRVGAWISAKGLITLTEAYSNLSELQIEDNQIGDDGLKVIMDNCKQLKKL